MSTSASPGSTSIPQGTKPTPSGGKRTKLAPPEPQTGLKLPPIKPRTDQLGKMKHVPLIHREIFAVAFLFQLAVLAAAATILLRMPTLLDKSTNSKRS